jgi:hypothetical protein
VDCDTCRLSYCLVCLASGSRDPCVRCGHRPSKRMEQLVHLRLKSIYKAFKSSSNSRNKNKSDGDKSTPSNATMASVAAANAKQQQQQNVQATTSSSSHHGLNQHHHSYHGPRRSKPTTLQDMVGDDDEDLDGDDDDNDNMMMMDNVLPAKFCHDLEQNFLAEQKKADAAAEALLAQLEEEEEANAKKKSKKKKKKKERKDAIPDSEDNTTKMHEAVFREQVELLKVEDVEKASSDVDSNDPDSAAVEDSPQAVDDQEDENVQMDPAEKELMDYVEIGYIEGIEDILFRLKGVPGKAALRKNAKKALKRLFAEIELMESSEADFEPVPESKPRQPTPSSPPKEVAAKPTVTTTGKLAHRSSSIQSTPACASKNETFVPISSTLVGWVIGKGGQRIRDMMESSGAKIWVDQEKVKGQPIRNVFVSGDKKCVEQGVQFVRDVIANAPPPPGSAPPALKAAAPAFSTLAPESSISAAVGIVEAKGSVSKQTWDAPDTSKQQTMADLVRESARNSESVGETAAKTHLMLASTPGNDAASGILTEVVSCETRFVPLLIGKRGWTIKNIQDESGARVDIDQTVTPRQVRISGSRTNVEKAVNMVRDVLSYPHAQLQHGSEELELIAAPDDAPGVAISAMNKEDIPVSPTKQKLLEASARLEKKVCRKETESPPPVVGDARSAISASSSLSSTPEPSMASSAKGALASQQLQAQLNSDPLLSPAPQQLTASIANVSNAVLTSFQQPELTLNNVVDSGGYRERTGSTSSQLHQNTSASSQAAGMSGNFGIPQYSFPETLNRHHSLLQAQHGMYVNAVPKSVSNQMNPGILPPHQPQYQRPQQAAQQSSSTFASSGHIPRQLSSQMGGSSHYDYNPGLAQNPRGYPSATGRSLHSSYSNEAANLIATTPLRDLMGHSMNRGPPPATPTLRPSGYRGNGGGGMWMSMSSNTGNLHSSGSGLHRSAPPPTSAYTQSAYGARNAGYTAQQHQQIQHPLHGSGLSGSMGFDANGATRSLQNYHLQQPQQSSSHLPLPYSRTGLSGNSWQMSSAFSGAPVPRPSSPSPKDDSGMLESLFGTAAGAGASDESGILLASLKGLSLGGDMSGGSSTGLWGPCSVTDSWTPATAGEKRSSTNVGHSSLGDILSGPMPSLPLDKTQESRFQWK